jgi:hypothetical protein
MAAVRPPEEDQLQQNSSKELVRVKKSYFPVSSQR